MKLFGQFWSSMWGHLTLAAVVVAFGTVVALKQKRQRQAPPLPAVAAKEAPSMPRTFIRPGQRVEVPLPAPSVAPAPVVEPLPGTVQAAPPTKKGTAKSLPLGLFAPPLVVGRSLKAPFGRLIPCVTVTTLESNHLETPLIGLVTEDIWHGGKLIVPAGAEVHGRADLDRNRERLAVAGSWMIVWRTTGADNGTELRVSGIALDRDSAKGFASESDGSAGLKGQVLRSGHDHALRLFAATFLATATSALQDTHTTAGLVGESSVPVTTARNATLAGTGAILREYAQQLRDAVAKDGFYLRVPAGKAFYLYVTQSIERTAPLAQP
jgi:hypothetical protein